MPQSQASLSLTRPPADVFAFFLRPAKLLATETIDFEPPGGMLGLVEAGGFGVS